MRKTPVEIDVAEVRRCVDQLKRLLNREEYYKNGLTGDLAGAEFFIVACLMQGAVPESLMEHITETVEQWKANPNAPGKLPRGQTRAH